VLDLRRPFIKLAPSAAGIIAVIVRSRPQETLSLHRLKTGFGPRWKAQRDALGPPPRPTPWPDTKLAEDASENRLEYGRDWTAFRAAIGP
jgi:hypothetical protein